MALVQPVSKEGIDTPAVPAAAAGTEAAKPLLRNGLDAVRQDHENLRGLMDAYKELCAGSAGEDAKVQAARRLVTAVTQHASAEERTVYPMINEFVPKEEGAKLLYDMMVMDDQINKEFLNLFETHTPANTVEWRLYDQQMTKFIMVEEEHLTKEEQTVLDRLETLLTAQQKDKLWEQFNGALRNAPLHPHPTVGGTTTLPARILHPIAGAVDRAAQAVSGAMQKVLHVSEQQRAAQEGHLAGLHPAGVTGTE